MGENAEIVGGSNADARGTMINTERGVMGVGNVRSQQAEVCSGDDESARVDGSIRSKQLFGKQRAEILDGVGLVAVGDEQGVLGLHDDEVAHA